MHRAIVKSHNKTTRMQTAIDRVVEIFNSRIRSESDIDEIGSDLLEELENAFKIGRQTERAQIEKAYQDGRNDMKNNDGISPQDYFNAKYGKG